MFYFILINFGLLMLCSGNKLPKFCVNCKYFITSADIFSPFGGNKEFGKCALFQRDNDDDNDFLVTGISKFKPIEYKYCSTARNSDSMCGSQGKFYMKKRRNKNDDDE